MIDRRELLRFAAACVLPGFGWKASPARAASAPSKLLLVHGRSQQGPACHRDLFGGAVTAAATHAVRLTGD